MKRLFVAIKINPGKDFIDQFRELKNGLKHEKIKWVGENNIHVTLKFLGETDEKSIPAIRSVLQSRALRTTSFAFSLKKLGIFGSRYLPRVIWTGIEPYSTLQQLMKDIQQDMTELGYEADRQNLVPHLTLGRIKTLHDKELFREAIEKHRDIKSSEMRAVEFHLYESILNKEGPVYLSLATFAMQK